MADSMKLATKFTTKFVLCTGCPDQLSPRGDNWKARAKCRQRHRTVHSTALSQMLGVPRQKVSVRSGHGPKRGGNGRFLTAKKEAEKLALRPRIRVENGVNPSPAATCRGPTPAADPLFPPPKGAELLMGDPFRAITAVVWPAVPIAHANKGSTNDPAWWAGRGRRRKRGC